MREAGTIVRFDQVRGYGFIAPEAGGDDLFLHANDLEFEKRYAKDGVAITFEPEEGERGRFGTGVRLVTPAPPRVDSDTSAQVGDDYYEILTVDEFRSFITETLLTIKPSLTGEQILLVRARFEALARKQAWIEP